MRQQSYQFVVLAMDIAEYIDRFRHGSTKCDGGHDLILASDFRTCIAVDKDMATRHLPCAHVSFHDQRNEIFPALRRLRAAHREELLVENIAWRIIAATSRVVCAR